MQKEQININKIILVSSCLIGKPCAYDGKPRTNESVLKFCEKYGYIDVCPEADGGLSCPRKRHEIKSGTGEDVLCGKAKVINDAGEDNSDAFLRGAKCALNICIESEIKVAIMKSKSPSCGKYKIHNGDFEGVLIDGSGVTAALLKKNDIKVFTEHEISMASSLIDRHRESESRKV